MNSKFIHISLLAIFVFVAGVLFPTTSKAVSLDALRIYGYFDLEYEQASNSQGNKNGSFDNHHFNLLMDFPVSNELIVKTHVEFEHGVDSGNSFGTVKLEWAFFEYSFQDAFQLRGGKHFSPFGFYNEIRDSTPAFLSLDVPASIYFSRLRGGYDFVFEQNTGINLLGQSISLNPFGQNWEMDYSVYVGNGGNTATTNPAEFDDNSNKAVGGRVNLYPSETFRVGLSFFTGDKAVNANQDAAHNTLAVSMGFDSELFFLVSEGAYSKFNGTEQYAGYLQASMNRGIYSPYYRYEILNPDTSLPDDNWKTHIIGLNSNLTKGMYLKTEIDYHDRGKGNRFVTKGQTTYFEYKAAVVVAF